MLAVMTVLILETYMAVIQFHKYLKFYKLASIFMSDRVLVC